MFSVILICCNFANNGFPPFFLSHTQSYLYCLILLILKALEKGSLPNNTIAPRSLIILLYCSHNGSNGITTSHLHCVVPYGKSQRIISILLSGISFIFSKQSP